MSKWLQSNTNLNYTANGKLIGKTPIQLSDAEYEKISKMPVIASLLKNGAIKTLDSYTAPVTGDAANQKLQELTVANARLADKVRELEAKAGAGDEAKIAELEKQLSEANAKFDELKAEAEAKIAELEEQLAKTSKKSSKKAEE